MGPGDGNARRIRLKIEELIDGIVSWQTPRYLADILTKFRIVDTQRDRGHLLRTSYYFQLNCARTAVCKDDTSGAQLMFARRQEGKVGMEEDGKVVEEERKVVVEMGIRTKNSWMPGGESILEPPMM